MRKENSLMILFFLLLVVFSQSCKPGKNKSKEAARPNIVYIMSDDHGYQAISCYNDQLIKTPNIDRIANEGVKFNRAFVTNSICAPSRATLLTGKFSNLNGLYDNRNKFDGSQVTFPKLLQRAGYQTALIGKWHLKSDPTGFDYWNILPGQGQYYNPDFIEMGNKKRVPGYATNLITDFSIDWLEKREPDKPFCLLMHEKAPHRTWMPDTSYLSMFEDENFAIPDNYFDDYEGRMAAKEQKMSVIKDMDIAYDLKMIDKEGEIQTHYRKWAEGFLTRMDPKQRAAWDKEYNPKIEAFKKANLKGKELAKWKLRRYLTDYLRVIASVDDNIGRLLDYLDKAGLSDNTIVVYTSDQGFYLGEHGWFDKRFMYEESFRTPLLIRYPNGMKRKGEINELVQNIDFAPTFLDYAGADIPKEIQGVSLRPLLENEKAPDNWRKSLYYHYYEFPNEHGVKQHYGVRTDRYKLIHFYNDIDEWEMFDLEKDPHEMNNIADDPAYKTIRKKLEGEILKLQKQYGDTEPEKSIR